MTKETVIKIENQFVLVTYDDKIVFQTILENIGATAMVGPIYMSYHVLDLSYRNKHLPPTVFYELARFIHQHSPDTQIDWLQTLFNVELNIHLDQQYKAKLSELSDDERLHQGICQALKDEVGRVTDDIAISIAKRVNYTLHGMGLPYFGEEKGGKKKVHVRDN